MALAPSLLPGFQYRVKPNGGDLAGEIITIVDNNTFPDSDARRRRVTVEHEGTVVYMLPRLIEDTPISATPVTSPEALMVQHGGVLLLDEVTQTIPVANPQVVAFDAQQQQELLAMNVVQPITDPMDDRLDHLRPKAWKIRKQYKNRTMSNGMLDVEYLLTWATDAYRVKNQGHPVNLALAGDTQSGKTFLVEALAVAWSEMLAAKQRAEGKPVTFTKPMPIFTLSGSAGVSDYDLYGQTTNYTDPLTGRSQLVWLPGVAEMAAQCGGILYLDEINAMRGNVTSALHPLIDHRHEFTNRGKAVNKGGQIMADTVTASLDLWVIATLNEGYQDMGRLNEAFKGRFETILWGYDEGVERQLVKSPPLRLFAEALRTAREGKALKTPIGTKALERFKLNIDTFGVDMAFEVFLGQFQPEERKKVSTIFVDRTFKKMLQDEVEQAARNALLEADAEADAEAATS